MDNQNNRNKQNLPGNNNPNNKNNRQRWNIILFTVMLISFIVFALYQFREDTDAREITYDQFLNMVDSGEVKKVVIEDDKIVITAKTEAEMKNSKKKGASESDVVEGSVADNNDSSSKDSSDDSTGLFSNVTRKQYYTGIVKDDTLSDRLYKAGVEYEQKIPDSTSYMVMNLLVNIVPLVIMIGLGVMLMRRMTKGGGMMGVGKSNAKMYVEKSTGVTFKDVAGQAEAKQEVEEIVEFLKQPQKYTELGGKIPDYFYEMIMKYRKRFNIFHAYYEQLMNMGDVMQTSVNGGLSEEEKAQWQLFSNRAERLHDHVEMLREYLVQIRELYQSLIAVQQNQVMSILTVVTTIFLPLTLIAGWYGMNFPNMPEFGWKYAYPAVIIVSILVIILEIIYFKKKKML